MSPDQHPPRVAIAGIHIESSTFTPYRSTASDFAVKRGPQMVDRYPWMSESWARQARWFPILHAGALPGGIVEREAYEGWKEEILRGLEQLVREAPLDGLLFDVHGAMSVLGMEDAEGDLIAAIRQVIGNEPLVSASMDLHGNVSHLLFDGCDLLTCYRTAPHVDTAETRERAARNLVDRLVSGAGKPVKALAHVPVLLPGEKTSTRVDPARSLYQMVPLAEARPGIIDAAIWVGFAWADRPRCKAAVVVTGDDQRAVTAEAEAIAQAFWDARDRFEFVAPSAPLDRVLEWAKTAQRPTFISDSGDNPGAGGADDVTYTLDRLLRWEPVVEGSLKVLAASIVDPAVIELAKKTGVGGQFQAAVGGKIDNRHPGPLPVTARVLNLSKSDRGGEVATLAVSAPGDPEGALAGFAGGTVLIVTSARDQYCELGQYLAAGVDPGDFDVVVVKIGYLEPDLYQIQRDWMMALTPGGVDQDLVRLGHSRIDRPMIPFDSILDGTGAGPTVRVVVSA